MDTYHAVHIPGTTQEYRWPVKIGERGAERLYRRREAVSLDPEVGLARALFRAKGLALVRWMVMPTIVSLTQAMYDDLCRDITIAQARFPGIDGRPEEIFGMWIERRDNTDLEGLCWVEIVDIRRAG